MGLACAQTSPTVTPDHGTSKPESTKPISKNKSSSSSVPKFAALGTFVQGDHAQFNVTDPNYPSVHSALGEFNENLGAKTHNNSENQYTKNLGLWSQIYKMRPGPVHNPRKASPKTP